MFIIYGQRKLRIKRYTEHNERCSHCATFDMTVSVYHGYFHLFFIPFWPISDRTSSIQCNNCGRGARIDSLQYQYERQTRKPFYLYTGLILIGSLVAWIAVANHNTQKEKRAFVLSPRAGDIYTMRHDSANTVQYYFLKVSAVKGDSVMLNHGAYMYTGFVSSPDSKDYFVEDIEYGLTKQALLQMLEEDKINGVTRH
ncbi:zinc ribbon domain-containing protein [Paraflavitalea sp. CAU 1676]|uniref:zinc ribbon domain-containing protein n=1 Tax=Paraflavitalea sp. CAU 1676 TaxID=3032598 RepID=UPI0023DC4AC3|nr:zinc ribbon domain-containing protein [Paraflavitalea sp. CAU 1676]MDF2188817.1 zinc ribbon domain-containing protein [Paraflavitalea sp. CAU 1676]